MVMTNRQIAERIKSDLNELIDRRGNVRLIPALIEVQKFINEIADLQRRINALNAVESDFDDC